MYVIFLALSGDAISGLFCCISLSFVSLFGPSKLCTAHFFLSYYLAYVYAGSGTDVVIGIFRKTIWRWVFILSCMICGPYILEILQADVG